MSLLFNVCCFLAALWISLSRGPGSAFALVYLPAVLLFSKVHGISIPMIPDANPPYGALYGILLATLGRAGRTVRAHRDWWFPQRVGASLAEAGRRGGFQLTWADLVVLFILAAYVTTAQTTGSFRGAMSAFGKTSLDLIYPYFLARFLLERPTARRHAALALIVTSLVIFAFAVIEFRLWPFFYDNVLRTLQLGDPMYGGAQARFGFFRAMVSFEHPIDLAIGAMLIAVMIRMLVVRCAPPVPRRWVQAGLAAAVLSSLLGVSFSAYMGIACGLAFYWVVGRFRRTQRFAMLGVAVLILSGFLYTSHQADSPLPEKPTDQTSWEMSYWTRQSVIKQAWGAATQAGLFGWGATLDEHYEFESVDNAYLVFAMLHGQVGLCLWLALPILVARVGARGLRASRSWPRYHATLVGMAAMLGTMVAMFTVWFGFLYPTLFMLLVALTVNAARAREAPRGRRVSAPREARHRPTVRKPVPA